MGNCVPIQKSMKLECPISSQSKSVQLDSTMKENTINGDHSMAELNSKHQSLSPMACNLGNQEEMFFDSQPWLDSDCEDFISVNGDFTPSCGNTPIHPCSSIETSQRDESPNMSTGVNSMPKTSATNIRSLVELFSDDNEETMEAKPISFYLPPKCTSRTPYESMANSVCSNETTPCRRSGKETPAHSAQCCFPNLVRSLSFSERKKRLSPAYACGGGQ